MGIPAFYRFIVERYPKSVTDVVEEAPAIVNGVAAPIDLCGANPNGVEFDNLYLDMNAIIHPCFHPEGLPPPKTYDEVLKAVFVYVDRIFSIIRPRKLLFLAIDGVAPRAKMNQQRARRFRAAKDASDEISTRESSKRSRGKGRPLELTDTLDSNVITPGTEFMSLLSSALQYYIDHRMNMNSGWQGIKVILSDASVPGEGEHKIISYVRLQRNLPGFDPNTRHCLYGLDADLIMLALATHELYFSVLREDVRKAQSVDKSDNQKRSLHNQTSDKIVINFIMKQKFQFLHVWILREYLAHELRIPNAKVTPILECLIDDFVFMCMFVGNDFLPHVPSLEISEGAIDLLMSVYKKEFVQMGGYLTNGFEVNLERVQHFIQAVGSHENVILMKRFQVQKGRDLLFGNSRTNSKVKGRNDSVSNDAKSLIDKVRLGEEGFKERYYAEKFGAGTKEDLERVQKQAVQKYIEGICWVMHYYYHGVCSWQWFYPYHYAPFASDLYDLDQLKIQFTLGKPFKPFNQLMAVLPAASAHALPLFYRNLMTDPSSPIFDFYPTDFELDMNGKQRSWQAVCKLPFIEESRLLLETAKVEHTLTDAERERNRLGRDILFVHALHSLATKIIIFSERNKGHPKLACGKVKRKINPKASGGMNGYFYISEKPVWPVEIPSPITGMELITENQVLSVYYKCPSSHPHTLQLPKGAKMPNKSISMRHIQPPPVLWHEKSAQLGRVDLQRPIPNCISGLCLEKFAHRLVTQQYPPGRRLERQEGAKEPVSTVLQNPVNGSHHVVSKEKRERKSKRNQATNERSNDAAVTVNCDDPAKRRQEKVEPGQVSESRVVSLTEPISTGVLNVVNGNHLSKSAKKSPRQIMKRNQAIEKCDNADPMKNTQEKVELNQVSDNVVNMDDEKCKPNVNEAISTGLPNGVNINHRDKPVKKRQKRIMKGNEANEKCDNDDPMKNIQEKVEPNQVSNSVVSMDDEKCEPNINATISTGLLNGGLLNGVNGNHQGKSVKKRNIANEKCDNADAMTNMQEKVEPNQVSDSVVSMDDEKCKRNDNEPISTDLLNGVNGNNQSKSVKKIQRRRVNKRNKANEKCDNVDPMKNMLEIVEPNQVSGDNSEKCKPNTNESVSTIVLNLVNESHDDESDKRSQKRRKGNQQGNKKCNSAAAVIVTGECDDADIVKPDHHVSGKCDEVEAEQNDIVVKKKGKRKRN